MHPHISAALRLSPRVGPCGGVGAAVADGVLIAAVIVFCKGRSIQERQRERVIGLRVGVLRAAGWGERQYGKGRNKDAPLNTYRPRRGEG